MKARLAGLNAYLSKTFDGMAKGLFASLLIGTIFEQFGNYLQLDILRTLGGIAKCLMCPCIGAGVAYAANAKLLTVFCAAVSASVGGGAVSFAAAGSFALPAQIAVGEPMGAYLTAIIAVEIGRRLEGKTKFDLLTVPGAAIVVAGAAGTFIAPGMGFVMGALGRFVNELTGIAPLPMGALLGVVVGMVLTWPISSAALCISIQISGLAAGAALAGCCAQMVGFAVCSFRENRFPGVLSQGLGTSMLQVPNILKHPMIWIPPTAASGVCGLLAAAVFRLECDAVGAGMGTCALVGPLRTLDVMGPQGLVPLLLCCLVIPAAVALPISEFMRKRGWIQPGDMKLS